MSSVNSAIDKFIQDSLSQATLNSTRVLLSPKSIRSLQNSIARGADRELDKLFGFIARNLIGLQSRQGETEILGKVFRGEGETFGRSSLSSNERSRFSSVVGDTTVRSAAKRRKLAARAVDRIIWDPLSPKTVKQKGNNRFYDDTGSLKSYFERTSAVGKFGGTKVTVNPTGIERLKARSQLTRAKKILAEIDIDFAPRVSPRMLPALAGIKDVNDIQISKIDPRANMEFFLFGPYYGQRLRGHPGKHRPLVQPVLAYWMKVRMPNAVTRAIENSISRRKSNTSDIFEFSGGGSGG